MRVARPIILDSEQEQALALCAQGQSLQARLAERAQIVLLAAAGKQDKEIAAELNTTVHKVARWRNRYRELGMAGLEKDAPRPGRRRSITLAQMEEAVAKTMRERPANAAHWSTRTLAAAVGLSETSVRRIWHKYGLKPNQRW